MKKKNLITSLLIATSIFLVQTQPIVASSTYSNIQKVQVTDYLNEIPQTRGADKPSGSSYVNLATTDYTYDVKSMQIRVFTNSLFSGVTGISVKVGSISIDKNGMSNQSTGISVELYEDKLIDKLISTKSVGVKGSETVSFTGLDKTKKYYVSFTKASDTQKYTFSGTISEK